ncbi:HIT domain-containing protein [Patescibacteria group bacterium]|nr:HIT domain-containing protein [Patescibacteria group bacterium]
MVKKTKKQRVDVKNSIGRTQYKKVLQKIDYDNVCPFCPKHFFKYHTQPIIHKGKYWFVTKNFEPYKGSKTHLLLVHKNHIEHISDLKKEAWYELLGHLTWVSKKFKLKGETLVMRYGDTRYNGASVNHLHAQIISGVAHTTKNTRLIKTVVGFGMQNKK